MRINISLALLLLLAGCDSAPLAPIVAPVSASETACRTGDDCDGKWKRAAAWVAAHSAFKIETSTDAVIKTMGPLPHDARPALTVAKSAAVDGVSRIALTGACGPEPGCAAALEALRGRFAAFVNATGALGEVVHGGKPIGLQLAPAPPGAARGMIVDSVVDQSIADEAGIKSGDVLTAIDGAPVNSEAETITALNAAASRHTCKLHLSRGGASRIVTVLF